MRSLLVFLLLFGAAFFIDVKPADLSAYQSSDLKVTVRGAVKNPGTYELEAYSSVEDLLKEAGLRGNADLSGINPQTILTDKDVVYVPQIKVTEEEDTRISINSSDAEKLTELPGIGQSTAEKIVAYREEHGLFQELDELMNVSGIGPNKFSKIRELITL